MKELMEYDNAASHFYTKHNLHCLPFNSWDISGRYFDEICKEFKNLNTLDSLAKNKKWTKPLALKAKVMEEGYVVLVTDADLRIVHATNNIKKMNGYTPEEVKGKRPSIFQGAETKSSSKELIREALREKRPFETVVINYKKDGTTYKCWIKAEPLFNKKGDLINFIAFEKAVA
ncbi:PAS domain-containing protein [Eudoraea chungangensis]|uniref:PAS domain-containing protein n=1 Tax=Eudoraea chungangensis TaxID=1481905 RepID=UPI0023EAC384|nr:PAS domain-containing protein [Eudoraea chungangensis]